MTSIVFIGPSRGRSPLTTPEGIRLLPPAGFGDLYRAAKAGVQRIGLVDAVFEDQPTVWHKEILWALSRGVEVYGAASMGALRAVECAPFGMVGIGRIFEMYRDGLLEDDHEVAVLHGPAELDFIPLTEPLVNLRASLQEASRSGVLTEAEHDALLKLALRRYYKTVTWGSLLEEARTLGMDDPAKALESWLPEGRVDLKRQDAEMLLARLSEEAPEARVRPAFTFYATTFWTDAIARLEGSTGLSEEEGLILDELRLDPPAYRDALLRAYARRTSQSDHVIDGTQESLTIEGFRGFSGLTTRESYEAWCAANQVKREDLEDALHRDEALEQTLDEAAPDLATDVLMELRIGDRYAALRRRAMDKLHLLERAEREGLVTDSWSTADLLLWYSAQYGTEVDTKDLDGLARAIGLVNTQGLKNLLRRERAYVEMSDGRTRRGKQESS